MTRHLLTFILLLASSLSYGRELTKCDIPYAPHRSDSYSDERCRLDINYDDTAQSRPVVVWFHGGGLTLSLIHLSEPPRPY